MFSRIIQTNIRFNYLSKNLIFTKKLSNQNVTPPQASSGPKSSGSSETPIRKLIRAKDIVDFIFMAFIGTGIYIGYKKYSDAKQNEIALSIKWLDGDISFFKKMFTCNDADPRYLPEYLVKILASIKSFKVRSNDVWIVSFPKSGRRIDTLRSLATLNLKTS